VLHERAGLGATALDREASFVHQLTHRTMRFTVFRARPTGRLAAGARWLTPGEAGRLGLAAWSARLLRCEEG
jgi:hypothetical protein